MRNCALTGSLIINVYSINNVRRGDDVVHDSDSLGTDAKVANYDLKRYRHSSHCHM